MPNAPSFFNSDTLRPGQIPEIAIESTAENSTTETLTVTGTKGANGVGPMEIKWRQRTAGSPWGSFSSWLTSPETGIVITRHALRIIQVKAVARDTGVCDLDCNPLKSEPFFFTVQPQLPALTEAGVLEVDTVDTAQLVAGAVQAAEIDVDELSAISADLGTVTVGTIEVNVLIKAEQLLADKIGVGPDASPDALATVSLVHFREDSQDSTLFVNAGKFTPQANDLRMQGLTSRPKLDMNSKTGLIFERMTVGHPSFADYLGTGTALEVYGLRIYDVVRDAAQGITTQWGLKIEDISVGTTKFAIQTGIGLVSFGDRLAVTSESASLADFATTITNVFAAFSLKSSASDKGVILDLLQADGTLGVEITYSEDAGRLDIQTRNAGETMAFYTAAAARAMTIDENQNVGIGTTTPIVRLEVTNVQNVGPQLRLSSKLANSITTDELIGGIDFWSNDPSEQGISAQILVKAPANHIVGDIPGYMSILLVEDGTNSLVERIRIQDDGDVTIAGEIISSQTGNTPGVLRLQRTDGTIGNNSDLGRIFFAGDEGSDQYDSCKIIATASEIWTGTAKGADLEFYVTPNTTETITLAMVIHQTGNVQIIDDLEIDGDLNHDGGLIGFYGAAPAGKPNIGGSRAGNAALTNLLAAMAVNGLITNNSTA